MYNKKIDGEIKMLPLISIVIPVYKTEEYLEKCVASVLNSKYENIEIILVDDGSPDGCPEICDKLSEKYEKIRVIHKANGGLSSARNAGLDIACGKYITFIDSDDLITQDMISEMYSIAVKENCRIVKLGMLLTENEDDANGDYSEKKEYTVVNAEMALSRIYSDPPSIVTICGKLYDISLFDDLRFPEGIINEDEYLTPRLFNACDKIALCDTVGYIYMQRPGDSIMRGAFSPKKLDILNIAEDRIALFEKWGYNDLAVLARRDYFCHLLNLRAKSRNTEFTNEYNEINIKLKTITYRYLSIGQKARLLLLKLNLYDLVFK